MTTTAVATGRVFSSVSHGDFFCLIFILGKYSDTPTTIHYDKKKEYVISETQEKITKVTFIGSNSSSSSSRCDGQDDDTLFTWKESTKKSSYNKTKAKSAKQLRSSSVCGMYCV